MFNEKLMLLAEALEGYEKAVGVEALGQVLADFLCAVSARRSGDNPQIWSVDADFVEGEVRVVFGPGQSIIDASRI